MYFVVVAGVAVVVAVAFVGDVALDGVVVVAAAVVAGVVVVVVAVMG